MSGIIIFAASIVGTVVITLVVAGVLALIERSIKARDSDQRRVFCNPEIVEKQDIVVRLRRKGAL